MQQSGIGDSIAVDIVLLQLMQSIAGSAVAHEHTCALQKCVWSIRA